MVTEAAFPRTRLPWICAQFAARKKAVIAIHHRWAFLMQKECRTTDRHLYPAQSSGLSPRLLAPV